MLKAQQVAVGVLGAGSKGVVSGLTQGLAPGVGVADDLVTGAVGFAMGQWGKGWIVDFGIGMALASVGALVSEPIERAFSNVLGTNTKTAAQKAAAKKEAPAVEEPPTTDGYPWSTIPGFKQLVAARESGDVRTYLALRYGIAG